MSLSASTLATDMDIVSASIEANDVAPNTLNTNATLKTASLRLLACIAPYVRAAGLGANHQAQSAEVAVAQNNTNAGG